MERAADSTPRAVAEFAPYLAPVRQAFIAALVLMGLKALIHWQDLEVLTVTPILTALLGGVIFTMAMILSGVLADFKEAERAIGELASATRRLHWDLAFVGADPQTVAALRNELRAFVAAVQHNAADGTRWKLTQMHAPLDTMDRTLAANVRVPLSTFRSVQIGLGTLLRIVDRLEVIIETTFMRAGYFFAAAALGLVVLGLVFTDLGGILQSLALVGGSSFILGGLFLLIWDMDNPMVGSVRISLKQLDKLAAFLERERPVDQPPAPTTT